MTNEQGLKALEEIVEALISNPAIKTRLLNDLVDLRETRGLIPVKGILAEVQAHGDIEVSEEIGDLIKEVYYYFA